MDNFNIIISINNNNENKKNRKKIHNLIFSKKKLKEFKYFHNSISNSRKSSNSEKNTFNESLSNKKK